MKTQQPTSEPTPERREKSLGYDAIGRRPGRNPKLMMTLDWIDHHRHFEREQYVLDGFRFFCTKVSEADGINAADDRRESTARGVSSYGDVTFVAYGPREGASDRAIEARAFVEFVRAQIPQDCAPLFEQLVGEETGERTERPKSLARYGNRLGWMQNKQSSASGATQAIMICRIVHAAVKRFQAGRMWKERGSFKR